MRVFINFKNKKQKVIEDVDDFLQYPELVVFKKKRNVSKDLFVMVEKDKINSIKINMKD